uniref:Uncharacterized protein n=1 Tax=Setaria viridis TaxID=4556 RepID=A0A4U6WS25_SETVI|nr:hypothetical protein SEVIR_1G349200v2 [Setaria viridis]
MRCVIRISILTLKDTKNPIANSYTRWAVDWYHMDHNNSNGLPVIEIPYPETSYLLSKSSCQDTSSSGASPSPFTVSQQFIGLSCDHYEL